MMSVFTLLAEALQYPYPKQIEKLRKGLDNISEKRAYKPIRTFVEQVEALSRSEWEELYTRTLDLNPVVAPYVGYQLWRENYKRGVFMSQLNHEMMALNINKSSELPDHLIPILRYLDVSEVPLPELVEVLPKALKGMHKDLKKNDPKNPYLLLLAAVSQACESLPDDKPLVLEDGHRFHS